MEKKKVVWGYCPVIDPKGFGYNTYMLLVKSNFSVKVEATAFRSLLEEKNKILEKMDDMYVTYSGYFHGDYDWIILFFSPDLKTARKCINKLTEGYSEYIDEVKLEEQLIPFRVAGFENPNLLQEIDEIF